MSAAGSDAPAARKGRAPYPELAAYSRVRPGPAANDNVRPHGWAWRAAGAVLGVAVAGGVALARGLTEARGGRQGETAGQAGREGASSRREGRPGAPHGGKS